MTTLEQKLKHAEYMRNYYHTNPKYRENLKRWQSNNPNKIIEYRRTMQEKTIRFKDKYVYLNKKVRIGICSKCGKQGGKTDIHHDKYDDSNPLAHTRELCVLCHKLEHGGRDKSGRWL